MAGQHRSQSQLAGLHDSILLCGYQLELHCSVGLTVATMHDFDIKASTGTAIQPAVSDSWVPSQYPKRRLIVFEVSKPRDWYFQLSYRFEIWQAHRQQCCRSACQISERSDNSKYKSRGFETSRDLTIRRHFWYWNGVPACCILLALMSGCYDYGVTCIFWLGMGLLTNT